MKKGFTLVELSIVLVILGLLVGGVLAGQNLIRAAELRSVVTEYTNFQTAVMTFKEKYFAIPGDMTNATAFWGTTTCPGTAGTGTQTCDGDGDGNLSFPSATPRYDEVYTFWQHLVNAGLIDGNYTGMSGAGDRTHHVPGQNAPASKLSGAGWEANTSNNHAGNSDTYALDYGGLLRLGKARTNGQLRDPILTPEEAWGIDTKADDGKPAKGRIIASHWNNACAAADDGSHANNDLEASYKLSDTDVECTLNFIQLF